MIIKKSAETIIEESIKYCQDNGIEIVRGPLFIWRDSITKPIACDCFGAVMYKYGTAKPSHLLKPGWLIEELCVDILGKDFYWFRRFSFGFNQGRSLEVYSEDEKGNRKYFKDKVSTSGNLLARRLNLYPKER